MSILSKNKSENLLTYPCKVMGISQGYSGSYSHTPHTTGTPKDYPWDDACSDTGRDWMYCPCDKMKITRIYGVGTKGTNTLWLQSTSKVLFADDTKDYVTMLVTHPDDDDLKNLKVGQTFKRGEAICREGTDGQATGNHFHFSAGKGKCKGSGWTSNSNRKWVLTTTKGTFKPEQLFYVDPGFTSIKEDKSLYFKKKPVETSVKGYATGNYKVTTDVLNVRKGAGTAYAKVKFTDMSDNAKKKIKEIRGTAVDGYVKGLTFTALQVKGEWGRTPSGWVCLKYCEKL